MHHRDRDIHRTGFTGGPINKPWPKKRRPLTLARIAPWLIAGITIVLLWSLK